MQDTAAVCRINACSLSKVWSILLSSSRTRSSAKRDLSQTSVWFTLTPQEVEWWTLSLNHLKISQVTQFLHWKPAGFYSIFIACMLSLGLHLVNKNIPWFQHHFSCDCSTDSAVCHAGRRVPRTSYKLLEQLVCFPPTVNQLLGTTMKHLRSFSPFAAVEICDSCTGRPHLMIHAFSAIKSTSAQSLTSKTGSTILWWVPNTNV